MKLIIILLLSLNLFSCASSIAKSSYACEAAARSEGLTVFQFGHKFLGNVFQFGDCAISERMRIERGTFVKNRSASIRKQITDDKAEYRDDVLALYELFGCSRKNENELIRFSKDNYSTLFVNSESSSGRQRMLSIRNKLKEDPVLKEMCFK